MRRVIPLGEQDKSQSGERQYYNERDGNLELPPRGARIVGSNETGIHPWRKMIGDRHAATPVLRLLRLLLRYAFANLVPVRIRTRGRGVCPVSPTPVNFAFDRTMRGREKSSRLTIFIVNNTLIAVGHPPYPSRLP